MNFKVWLKSRAADRVLAPLREELVALIEQDASLLEIGCGTGDLLFRSASRISRGYGIDLDSEMIRYAESRRRVENIEHLRFACMDALDLPPGRYDIATSTLCLHEMPRNAASAVLKTMVDNADKVLIADYSTPKTLSGKLGIEVDELFSGHYGNFRRYRKAGEIPIWVAGVGATIRDVVTSSIDGISIWVIDGKTAGEAKPGQSTPSQE